MITRKEAIEDIRMGRGIAIGFSGTTEHHGIPHTFNVIIRRTQDHKGAEMLFDCSWYGTMPKRAGIAAPIRLTAKQVLGFIRRNYKRHLPTEVSPDVRINETLRDLPVAEVAA